MTNDNCSTFFKQDTVSLAKDLLGKLLIMETEEGPLGGYIVETEAYLGVIDQAAHTYLGRNTPKVKSMYKEAGTVYVYTMHTHQLLNIVSCTEGIAQAVLIRAIEPAIGIAQMERNRGKSGILLTNGPGKFTKARKRGKEEDGTLMQRDNLKIDFCKSRKARDIISSPRIGIPNKGMWTEKHLRFYVKGNPYVSGIKKSETTEMPWTR
jgi:DNA-3-methyladenine glycosylase